MKNFRPSKTLPFVLFALGSGCFAKTIGIHELEPAGSLEVVLDSNLEAYEPGRRIKFFVDITNRSSFRIDLKNLKLELLVSPEKAPEVVSLRQPWSYRWGRAMFLEPGTKLTLPVVPEQGVELPLEHLSAGNYRIVAVLNGSHASKPYRLRVGRPDLGG